MPDYANLAFSADGKILFAVSDGMIQRLDAVTGRVLSCVTFDDGRKAKVTDCNFRLDRLVVRANDDTIVLREATSGKEIRKLTTKHRDVASAVLSPDGKLLATRGCNSTSVCLWNTASGEMVRQLGDAEINPEWTTAFPAPRNLAFSSDGKLASANENGEISIWDYRTGKKLSSPDTVDDKSVTGLTFSPDGKLLLWEKAHFLFVWDVAASRRLCLLLPVPTGQSDFKHIQAIYFSSNSKALAIALTDNTLSFWNATTGEEIKDALETTWESAARLCRRYALSPDGRAHAKMYENDIFIVSPDVKDRPAPVGHIKGVSAVAWSADGAIVASNEGGPGHYNQSIRTWDVPTSKPLQEFPYERAYTPLALAPDGSKVLVPGAPPRLRDTNTGRRLHALRQQPLEHLDCFFSPDGRVLTTWDSRPGEWNYLRRWHVATGKELSSLRVPAEELTVLGFGPSGHLLFLDYRFERICLRSLEPSQQFWSIRYLAMPGEDSNERAISSDGRLIALQINRMPFEPDGELRGQSFITVRETRSGKELAHLDLPSGTHAPLAVAPNGSMFAVALPNEPIRLYAIGTDKPYRELAGHHGSVLSLAFSPDGNRLLSGGEDTTILIWDVADRQRPLLAERTSAELQRLWTDLASDDAVAAHAAMLRLADSAKQAIPFLKQRLQPDVDPKLLAALIADLDDETFTKRQQAERDLTNMGEEAEGALEEMVKSPVSLEARLRAERILDVLHNKPPRREDLRRHRALAVLERIGSPEAKAILEILARGAPRTQQTLEARTALQRLTWRQAKERRKD